MKVHVKYQLLFWGIALCVLIAFIVIFKGILLPFVLGIAVAYLLNPIVVKLGHIGLKRRLSAITIVAMFFAALLTMAILFLPMLFHEITDLSKNIPRYYDQFVLFTNTRLEQFQILINKFTGNHGSIKLSTLINGHSDKGFNILQQVLSSISNGGRALFGTLSLLLLTPIVSYFMIKEWPTITNKIEDLLPHDHRKTIKSLWDDIDAKLSGFVRGQISVAFILGTGYALALSIADLKYGMLIGLTAGVLSIIPLFGSVTGLLISLIVAWFQTSDVVFVGIIAGIFITGQFIEGHFLTPKLIGDSVGLHPLWVIFALMAGGSLFGILGMLLAVPVTATIAVLASFLLSKYKGSALYKHKKRTKRTQNT